jgi:nitrogen regulatory protein PII
MHYMVLLIIDDLKSYPAVLDAWDAAKVPGITILDSTGMGKVRQESIRDDIPMMPSLSDIFRSRERRHRTIFSVVEGEEKVDQLVKITQEILGDLNKPDTGVLFVLPVSRVVGLHGAAKRAQGAKRSP